MIISQKLTERNINYSTEKNRGKCTLAGSLVEVVILTLLKKVGKKRGDHINIFF